MNNRFHSHGTEGGDSCGMSETNKTSQNDAYAAVMAYRSPHGKRPPVVEWTVKHILCGEDFTLMMNFTQQLLYRDAKLFCVFSV